MILGSGLALIVVTRPAETLVLAYDHGRYAGFARLVPSTWGRAPYREAMELYELVVEPEHRRRGVGTALVRRAFAWTARRGYEMTMVTAHFGNEAAISFYRSLGMTPHYVTFDNYKPPGDGKTPP